MTNIVHLPLENPVSDMMDMIGRSGRSNFQQPGQWEVCLSALIMALRPSCKTYELLEALPAHQNRMDQMDALNTIAHMGYMARPGDNRPDKLDGRLLPALFISSKGVPSILLGKNDNGSFRVYDTQGMSITEMRFPAQAQGRLWFFQRFDENRPATSKFMRAGSGHTWFRALLGRFKGTFAQVMTAGLILNILALASPLFIMVVYDRVIAAGAPDVLPMLVVGALLALVFEWRLRRIRSQGLSWLAGRMDNIVGNKIFAHLIGLSPSLIERASVASQVARIKTFESVRDFFSGSVFLSLLEMPFVVIAVAAIWAIAGSLVLVPVTVAFAYVALYMLVQREIKVAIRLAAKASSSRQSFTIETFEKIRAIRSYGLSVHWQEKFRDLSGKEMMSHFHLGWLGMVAETAAHSLTLLSAVATVGFGVHMIWAGAMTSGALVATMILVWRVLTPFYSLCTMIPRLEQLRNSIIQVNKLMDIDVEAVEARAYARLPKMKGAISASQLMLRYEEDSDPALQDLSFDAQAGDIIAVTGENGAGKSTLLKMIKGMYRPTEGTLRLDGFDIRQLDVPDLRRHIAYVPQRTYFFKGTVAENLRISNPIATEDDIHDALIRADAWEDVQAMRQGIHTPIGFDALRAIPTSLATRLSLARAYLHPAPILIIDELPNNFLSSRAGQNLKDYLVQHKGKRTCVITTYREDFMKLADTIILLRNGEKPLVGAREPMLEVFYEENAA